LLLLWQHIDMMSTCSLIIALFEFRCFSYVMYAVSPLETNLKWILKWTWYSAYRQYLDH